MQFQTVGLQLEVAFDSIMHPALSRLQEYRADCPRVDRPGMTLHNVLSSDGEEGHHNESLARRVTSIPRVRY
jgi:hypothetical protein